MTLKDDLNPLLDSEIAVAMSDGMGYRGKLEKFDDETIVLVNVYETSTKDVDWKGSPEEASKRGFASWRHVLLPKVIIRVPMVLRIWPWQPLAEKKE